MQHGVNITRHFNKIISASLIDLENFDIHKRENL